MTLCPWCKSEDTHLYLPVKDLFLTQESFCVMQCDHCGLLFTDPRPDADHIGAYYESEDYLSHQENNKGLVPRIYEKVKQVNLRNKRRMALQGLAIGRLLDIGCGVGDFLRVVKASGWEVAGIEPSAAAQAIAAKRLGFMPLPPSAASSLADASFDVITMWHVLEHVDDLHEQFASLQRLLKPGGRLILALPNYQSYDAAYYKSTWAAWDVPRHLNHFNRDFLVSNLSDFGFEYIDTQRLKWDAFYISFLSEHYLGHSLPLVRGAYRGLVSNVKAHTSGQYSSLVYRFQKL